VAEPIVFISSSESGNYNAYALGKNLSPHAEVIVRTDTEFRAGRTFIESFESAAERSDFAILKEANRGNF